MHIKRKITNRLREVILLCFAFMRLHLKNCIQLWGSQHKANKDLIEGIQRRAPKMIIRLEHLCYDERLRELGLLSLQKRRLWGDPIAALHYTKWP